jgi:hypothetical protein
VLLQWSVADLSSSPDFARARALITANASASRAQLSGGEGGGVASDFFHFLRKPRDASRKEQERIREGLEALLGRLTENPRKRPEIKDQGWAQLREEGFFRTDYGMLDGLAEAAEVFGEAQCGPFRICSYGGGKARTRTNFFVQVSSSV